MLQDKEVESRINNLYEELNEEKKTAVSAATSIAQLNWITEQVGRIRFLCNIVSFCDGGKKITKMVYRKFWN